MVEDIGGKLEFEKDEFEVEYVKGIEMWFGSEDVLIDYVVKSKLPIVWDEIPAKIFEARTGWIALVFDEDETEWFLAGCYIPDPEHELTLNQLLEALSEVRETLLNYYQNSD